MITYTVPVDIYTDQQCLIDKVEDGQPWLVPLIGAVIEVQDSNAPIEFERGIRRFTREGDTYIWRWINAYEREPT